MPKSSLYRILLLASILTAYSFIAAAAEKNADEVNVYSSRQEHLIRPLLDNFSDKTGIKVNLVTGNGGALLTRLAAEGENSPADVFITTDVAYLERAKKKRLTQAVASEFLRETVPANYRDADNHWFGLSLRVRAIFAQRGRLDDDERLSYESLAEPRWRKQLCIRSSANVYNQSLVASMIAARGEAEAGEWIKNLVANFARPPGGNDRDQIMAVAGGRCSVAVANSYYLGIMLKAGNEEQKEAAQKVAIHWPNQADRGAHINLSGAFVTKNAAHRQHAILLIEHLLSAEMQNMYMDLNYEYPVRDELPLNELLSGWGSFKKDQVSLNEIGRLNEKAARLMDKGGWR